MTPFALGPYHIEVATDFGPRITSLRHGGGAEILARLDDDAFIEHVGGIYQFRGGHRLWAAPETPEITYAADDHSCGVSVQGDEVTIVAPADSAGMIKEITIAADDDDLIVEHRMRRSSQRSGFFAGWAITQFPLGGTAILGLNGDDTAPLPNRQIVLWPGTSISDRRLQLGDHAISLSAEGGPPLKVGSGPGVGRVGYHLDGQLFTKVAVSASKGPAPDLGATRQVYLGQGFCELETVGGMVDREATLTERWTVVACDDLESARAIVLGEDAP